MIRLPRRPVRYLVLLALAAAVPLLPATPANAAPVPRTTPLLTVHIPGPPPPTVAAFAYRRPTPPGRSPMSITKSPAVPTKPKADIPDVPGHQPQPGPERSRRFRTGLRAAQPG